MQIWSTVLALPIVACSLSGQLGNKSWSGPPTATGSGPASPGGTSGSAPDGAGQSGVAPGGASGSVVMPTITGLPAEQARAALAAAGLTPREFAANPHGACDVPADETMLRPGTLCTQYPARGALDPIVIHDLSDVRV